MNNKPAIAIVVPGGIGIDDYIPVLLELLCHLARPFDVSIYSFSEMDPHPSLASNFCTVHCAPRKLKFNILKAFYHIWKIRQDHAIKHFSIIHGFWIMLQGIVAVFAGKLLNIPSIVTLPGGDITYIPAIRYGSLSNHIKIMMSRWCVQHASRVVTLTRYQQTIMKQRGLVRSHIAIFPFGINLARFQFHPHPFAVPLQLMYIGNLNRVKDPWILIKTFHALTKNSACRLTVIGSDVLNGQVQEFARELGVEDLIRWMGKLRYEEIPSQLSSADILLMTSLYEGQSVAVMEAFASGVVVVGTNVGVLADIGNEAVTVNPGDSDGLARKIEALIHHPETICALQIKNREYAELFSSEWTFKEYTKLYNELIIQK